MKYAIEVAEVGSLSKAAEILLIAAPNISRSIKELEADIGITIFDRSAKGMELTPEGKEFIIVAKDIITRIENAEKMYKQGARQKQKFSISVPRASYISEAFADFSKKLTDAPVEIFYKETNSQHTIKNILEHDYKLGVIRYAENYEKYFKSMLDEKDMVYELVTEFTYSLVMSVDSPLASKETITFDDLTDYIEIAHADPYVPLMPLSKVIKEELPESIEKRIFVFERASQFDLLSTNPKTFMWVSPIPHPLLNRYGLVQRKCEENKKVYKDYIIYKKDYELTTLDHLFITELFETKRKYCSD